LHACPPAPLWQAFLATSGAGGDFGFLTDQLDELVVVEESIMYPGSSDPAEGHYAVDRATLRRLLLAGLDDKVHFGAEFQRYESGPDGPVTAVFADGRRAVGDVLVGADGASSRVQRQYLPQAVHVDAGVGAVAHKLFLTDETRTWVPQRLQTGMNLIITKAPVSLFTSVYDPPPGGPVALERVATPTSLGTHGRAPHPEAPYLLCALNADPAVLPATLSRLEPDALRQVVDDLVADWHPDLRRVLAESDPASRSAIEFSASTEIPPWPTSRVTVLGDAIHTMPATGGRGGNTAMRDANLLTHELDGAARGERDLITAIRNYETDMRDYGYAAIRGALATKDQMLSTGAVSTFTTRTWLRLCRALPALRRRSFHDWSASAAPRDWEHARSAA
ncbi:MAG TPA: FAD-dependent monooxygenase, partial [Kineosporiaceae bacterium]|nr:FAD-dependent monooxygenase [Kineosporiaceae bacterium]